MKIRKDTLWIQNAKAFAAKKPYVFHGKPVVFIPAGHRGPYLPRVSTCVLPPVHPVLKRHGITWEKICMNLQPFAG